MKANEAPEKIYIACDILTEEGCAFILEKPVSYLKSVEYTRTDAFIEKADKFISSFFHPDDTELRNCLLKKFHEYLKEE